MGTQSWVGLAQSRSPLGDWDALVLQELVCPQAECIDACVPRAGSLLTPNLLNGGSSPVMPMEVVSHLNTT